MRRRGPGTCATRWPESTRPAGCSATPPASRWRRDCGAPSPGSRAMALPETSAPATPTGPPAREARRPAAEPVRIMRIIARLNVGGPAIHTALLTHGLENGDYHSLLVTGTVGEHEGDMSYVARGMGIEPTVIPEIGRELSWRNDWVAFWKLFRLIRAFRPRIVHTHTAKAGAIGRMAAVLAGVPVRVHTYHGNVFRGYFSRAKTRMFLWIERLLGRFTQRVVAISDLQRDELCDLYRVIPRQRCRVIPLG